MESVLNDCNNYLASLLNTKIKDSNRSRSNLANPHNRLAVTHPIHYHIYQALFANKLKDNEQINSNKHSSQHLLETFHRVCVIFNPSTLLKMQSKGDILLICPWVYLNTDIDTGNHFAKGRLGIPLSCYPAMGSKVTVFFPSGGPEDMPDVFKPVSVKELFPVQEFPYELVPLTNVVTDIAINTEFEFFNAPKGEIKKGDVIAVSSDRYVVDSVGTDVFKPWTDLVSIGKNNRFKRNNKKRPLHFGSLPTIVGKILHIDKKNLGFYHHVDIHFKKQSKFNHGTLNVSYKNAIFNEAGFLTHDVAIVL